MQTAGQEFFLRCIEMYRNIEAEFNSLGSREDEEDYFYRLVSHFFDSKAVGFSKEWINTQSTALSEDLLG